MLKKIREKTGLSYREYAKKTGIGASQIQAFESEPPGFLRACHFLLSLKKYAKLSNSEFLELLKSLAEKAPKV